MGGTSRTSKPKPLSTSMVNDAIHNFGPGFVEATLKDPAGTTKVGIGKGGTFFGLSGGIGGDDEETYTPKDLRTPTDPAAARFAEFQLRRKGKLGEDEKGRSALTIPRSTGLGIPE